MNPIAVAMAKLAGLQKVFMSRVNVNLHINFFDPAEIREYFEIYSLALDTLQRELPDLFADMRVRPIPIRLIPPIHTTIDNHNTNQVPREYLLQLMRDIDYIFEVRSHSELEVPVAAANREQRVFISHGRTSDWREVQAFIEKDLSILTLELAQEPNRGRTVLQKLAEESNRCCYAVIVMTGDDKTEDGQRRTRENVMHEIGYFQGKFGLPNVCLLHEEGVNIPSNIHGLVYAPFPSGMVSAAFTVLSRELRAVFK
jgi:hypothetical protein